MRLEINGQVLEVPIDFVAQLSQELWGVIETLYEEKIPDTMKTGMMIPVRAMLVQEEMTVRMRQGKEAARAMRPPPKEDVNLWLFRKFLPYVQEQLNHANITISCEAATSTVTDFRVSIPRNGESGEQMGFNRDERVWQNNGVKVS